MPITFADQRHEISEGVTRSPLCFGIGLCRGWRYGVTLTLSYSRVFCFRSCMSSESEQAVASAFHLMRSLGKPRKRIFTDEQLEQIGEILAMRQKADLHEWERQWG